MAKRSLKSKQCYVHKPYNEGLNRAGMSHVTGVETLSDRSPRSSSSGYGSSRSGGGSTGSSQSYYVDNSSRGSSTLVGSTPYYGRGSIGLDQHYHVDDSYYTSPGSVGIPPGSSIGYEEVGTNRSGRGRSRSVVGFSSRKESGGPTTSTSVQHYCKSSSVADPVGIAKSATKTGSSRSKKKSTSGSARLVTENSTEDLDAIFHLLALQIKHRRLKKIAQNLTWNQLWTFRMIWTRMYKSSLTENYRLLIGIQ